MSHSHPSHSEPTRTGGRAGRVTHTILDRRNGRDPRGAVSLSHTLYSSLDCSNLYTHGGGARLQSHWHPASMFHRASGETVSRFIATISSRDTPGAEHAQKPEYWARCDEASRTTARLRVGSSLGPGKGAGAMHVTASRARSQRQRKRTSSVTRTSPGASRGSGAPAMRLIKGGGHAASYVIFASGRFAPRQSMRSYAEPYPVVS